MRKQYHFWPNAEGLDAWDVDRLVAMGRSLPAEQVEVTAISEVDTVYWFDESQLPVRLPELPDPDFRNCSPEGLPY